MKFGKHFTKISLLEICIDFFLLAVLLNVASFTITVLEGEPRLLLFDLSWIFQFVLPFLYVLIHNIYHSEALLILKYQNTPNIFLTEKPDNIICKDKSTFTYKEAKLSKDSNITKRPVSQELEEIKI